MEKSLKFVIAEDDQVARAAMRKLIEVLGHQTVADASNGRELIDAVDRYLPDVVLTDVRMEGMDGLEAISIFSKQHSIPAIVVSGCEEILDFETAGACAVYAYLPKPITRTSLSAAIDVAMRQHAETKRLHAEIDVARRRLNDRVMVERAKGVLMIRMGIDEQAAYEKMRLMARNSCQTLGQVARSFLSATEVLAEFISSPTTAKPPTT